MTGSGISEATSLLGKWYTCNYGQAVPESLGALYTFDAANARGVTLPTKDQFALIYTNCTFTWLTVHGQQGTVVQAGSGFLFLPAQSGSHGNYWSSTEDGGIDAWSFFFLSGGEYDVFSDLRSYQYAVRPIQ